MAHFIAGIEGNRGPSSRLGSAASGVMAKAYGWNVGVRVYGGVEDGHDSFTVIATGGSNGRTRELVVAIVREGRVILDPFGDVAGSRDYEEPYV